MHVLAIEVMHKKQHMHLVKQVADSRDYYGVILHVDTD